MGHFSIAMLDYQRVTGWFGFTFSCFSIVFLTGSLNTAEFSQSFFFSTSSTLSIGFISPPLIWTQPTVGVGKLTSSKNWWSSVVKLGYVSIPINTIFSGMNIHLPAILGFTRGIGFWPTATWVGDDIDDISHFQWHPSRPKRSVWRTSWSTPFPAQWRWGAMGRDKVRPSSLKMGNHCGWNFFSEHFGTFWTSPNIFCMFHPFLHPFPVFLRCFQGFPQFFTSFSQVFIGFSQVFALVPRSLSSAAPSLASPQDPRGLRDRWC